ncbi:unnamed protein product [Parascedosporium putredinis]|uniref:Adenosylmethionine decarboxylase n=1 Tax=Parascedosporium putredinis TaxID=1442378 RepID=A0A9P1M8T5_9PEZI|nr:unnamed protein product [Parascedosporium putredinis]CAI7990692.1 unnamed protein product [Parascedosporium putredinis]
MVTLPLTINHDVATDLDSTNAFEGPEKLLEVWFAPSPTDLPPSAQPTGLKAVSPETWKGMLDMVNCEVLSVLESDHVDAYLLSESSMFVFPHKLILKTCGTTTLLLGLQRLLHIAAVDAGFPFHNAKAATEIKAAATPYRFFYSRKNFCSPTSSADPTAAGSRRSTLTPPVTPDEETTKALTGAPRATKIPAGISHFVPSSAEEACDETLEILMTDLDQENAKQFYLSHASAVASDRESAAAAQQQSGPTAGTENDLGEVVDVFSNGCESDLHDHAKPGSEAPTTTEGHTLGTVVSDNSGLSSIYPNSVYPDARIDAYMFSPCGFSANGVVPAPPSAKDDAEGGANGEAANAAGATPSAAHYFTVHVTPEPNCSFASFETNVPSSPHGRSTAEIIEHVVNIFKPGRFSVTLFEGAGKGENTAGNDESLALSRRRHITRHIEPVRGYRRVERIFHEFDDYDLAFRYYEREGWNGAVGTRVGEDD